VSVRIYPNVRFADPDLARRAVAAYFRSGETDQPQGRAISYTVNGLTYIVLRNVNGVVAVYRVTNRGDLKRLKRWPAEVNEWQGHTASSPRLKPGGYRPRRGTE
jgi:hypothetical protein